MQKYIKEGKNTGTNKEGVLTVEQRQVLLTGFYGDGGLYKNGAGNYYYAASSITKDLLTLKRNLLGDLKSSDITKYHQKNSFKKGSSIYNIHSKASSLITDFYNRDVKLVLGDFTELGIALWFYDDGSLHKSNYFYNLCTHAYSREYQEEYLLPLLETFKIKGKITVERKKDGREFYYIRVGKHDGAFNISEILRKYPVRGMEYKIWGSDFSEAWCSLLKYFDTRGETVSKLKFTNLLKEKLNN